MANNIGCFTTFINIINVPMTAKTHTSSTFFPMNFTVLLKTKAMTAQETLAIEFIVKIIGSKVSMHTSSISNCKQKVIDYFIDYL